MLAAPHTLAYMFWTYQSARMGSVHIVLLLDGDELATYQDAMGKFRFQVMTRGNKIWVKVHG
jgi:hypothetical protein